MMKKYTTKEGKTLLENKLRKLKTMKAEQIQQVAHTASFGDIGYENVEFDAATEALEIYNAIRKGLETRIAISEIIETPKNPTKVTFGTKVEIYDFEKDIYTIYRIVGPNENNLLNEKYLKETEGNDLFVSYTSPVIKALLQKEVGDIVGVKVPKGNKNLEVIKIQNCFEGLKVNP